MRHSTSALLTLLVLGACANTDPGSFSLTFTWDAAPEATVHMWLRVEARPDKGTPGPILASAGPLAFTPGVALGVTLPRVPNGAERRVVVEVREEPNANLATLWYGISEVFDMAPGQHPVVDVPLSLQRPEADRRVAERPVEIHLDGEEVEALTEEDLGDVTLVLRSVGAVAVVLANDASFSAGLRTVRFDEGDLDCDEEMDGDGEAWTRCELHPWDLSAGLPELEDGLLGVYARFVDENGYESALQRASVYLDSQGPLPLVASVTPQVAGPAQVAYLTVNFQESLDGGEGAATLEIVGGEASDEAPIFEGPDRVGDSNAYVWRADLQRAPDGAVYGFRVRARDSLGNERELVELVDEQREAVRLVIDARAPRLGDEPSLSPPERRFGIERPGEEEANQLEVRFVIEEEHPPLLESVEGACVGVCPELRLDGRAVGTVQRDPDSDDPSSSGLGFVATYAVRAEDWGAVEREVSPAIWWRDQAGNEASLALGDPIALDFVRPRATCRPEPALVNAHTAPTLIVQATEPLAGEPALEVQPSDTPLFTGAPQESEDRIFTWSSAPGGAPDDSYIVRVSLTDQAGNRSEGEACQVSLRLDATPPEVSQIAVGTEPEVLDEAGGVVRAAGPGDRVEVRFHLHEEGGLAEAPVLVELQSPEPLSLDQVSLDEEMDGGWLVQAWATMDPALHAAQEGAWPVRLEVRDEAGNVTSLPGVLDDARVQVDFTAPMAECTVLPAESEGPVPIDGALVLQVSPFEALKAHMIPVLGQSVEPPLPPGEELLSFVTGSRYRFERVVQEGDGERGVDLRVTLEDRVGNRTDEGATACIQGVVQGSIDGERAALSPFEVQAVDVDLGPSYRGPLAAQRSVAASFVVWGADAEDQPELILNGEPMLPADGWPQPDTDGGWRWRFERALTGDEAEGPARVQASGVDRAGNPYFVSGEDAGLVLDFTPPMAECFVNLEKAKAGDQVRLSLAFGEPIDPDSLAVVADLPLAPDLDESDMDGSGTRFLYVADVAPGDPRHAWSYTAQAADVAGNQAQVALCEGGGLVDGQPIVIGQPYAEAVYVDDEADESIATGLYARDGSQVSVRFTLDDAPAEGSLKVLVGDTPVPECQAEGDLIVCTHEVDAAAVGPAQPEGAAPISIEVEDEVGNRSFASPGTLMRDYTDPALAGEPYFERLDGYARARLALNDLYVQEDSAVRVTFSLKEGALEAPAVRAAAAEVRPSPWDDTMRFVDVVVPPPADEGEHEVEVALRDLAGNPARLSVGRLRADHHAPDGLSSARVGHARHLRALWGAEETAGASLDRLQGCPAPADEVWPWCPSEGEAFEPGARVQVWRGQAQADGQVACTDQFLIDADTDAEDGALQVTVPGDWPALCVDVVDRAGNASTRRVVPVVRWVASTRGKRPGSDTENPHGVRAVGMVGPALDPGARGREIDQATYGALADPVTPGMSLSLSRAWRALDPSPGSPPARSFIQMAADPARGRLVTFGGDVEGKEIGADTWEWDGTRWVEAPVIGDAPSARTGYGITYDAARGRVVLFGGTGFSDAALGDLWEWDGQRWTPITWAGEGPEAVAYPALGYDRRRGRVVLYGGRQTSGLYTGKLWEWDGQAWERRTSDGDTPGARIFTGMTWHDGLQALIVFGGKDGDNDLRDDLWAWDGEAWVPLEGQGDRPSARRGHGLVYDPDRERLLLYGGYDEEDYLGDTFSWNDGMWQEHAGVGAQPEARHRHAMALDPVTGEIVLFGGFEEHDYLYRWFDDTWVWDGDAWREATPTGARPEFRSMPTMVYDVGADATRLFGGAWLVSDSLLNSQVFNDLWQLGRGGWVSLQPAEPLPPRLAAHDMTYDRTRGRAAIYGGATPTAIAIAAKGDLWSTDGAAWTRAVPETDRPVSRIFSAIAYDEARDRMVVFGGCRALDAFGNCSSFVDDTWEWDGLDWTRVDPMIAPSARAGHRMVYDPVTDAVTLFGGCTEFNLMESCTEAADDTWLWDGAVWTQVAADGPAPPARAAHGMRYDRGRARVVVFGGEHPDGGDLDYLVDTWEWDGETWREATAYDEVTPSRTGHALAYDERREELLVFGGFTKSADDVTRVIMRDTWRRDLDPERKPGVLVSVDWAEAEVPTGRVELVDVAARAGGLGYTLDLTPGSDEDVVGEPSPGTELHAWNARAGAWEVLASNEESADDPDGLDWSSEGSDEARDLILVRDRSMHLRVVPAAFSGNGPEEGRVRLDFVEVRVDYRWPETSFDEAQP